MCTFCKSLECWKIGILEDWAVEVEMISLKLTEFLHNPLFHDSIIPLFLLNHLPAEPLNSDPALRTGISKLH